MDNDNIDLTIPRDIPPPRNDDYENDNKLVVLPPLPPPNLEEDSKTFITLSIKDLHNLINSECGNLVGIRKHSNKTGRKVRKKKSNKKIILEYLKKNNDKWCGYKEIKNDLENYYRDNSLTITSNLANQLGSNLSILFNENLILKIGKRRFYKYKINLFTK
jgi:hypothetical protein